MKHEQLGYRLKSTLVALALAGVLGGCATSGNPKDPIEGFNRAMYAFNDGLDTLILKPVAQGYETVLPPPIRSGINNFFANIGDVFIGVNNLLQGKPDQAASDLGRVLLNSTFGLLGILDLATDAGLEKHEEDFGQTLGRWGIGDGPYLMWPVIGPKTLRDTAGFVLDVMADPVGNIDHVPTRNVGYGTRFVDNRADLLPAQKVIDEAALDKYSYVRDGYLQRRRNLIHDGNPPRESLD